MIFSPEHLDVKLSNCSNLEKISLAENNVTIGREASTNALLPE